LQELVTPAGAKGFAVVGTQEFWQFMASVSAIKQALSILRQAREALLFAQCPAAVAKVRQAHKSTEGALRTVKRRVQSSPVAPSGAHSMARPPVSLAAHDKR